MKVNQMRFKMKKSIYLIAVATILTAAANAEAKDYMKKNWLEKKLPILKKTIMRLSEKLINPHFHKSKKTL